ncbi:M10 family metallopeptidase [Chachezhania sediminis]|uniref:M10 family metallopeptidase n=1 Tax=Chachezhania sediminis TaxID=2599291 RepID=UPI002279116F|nr:M10 family metallopeptidase [Chachezhania sediminis]
MCQMCHTLDPSKTTYDSHGLTNLSGTSVSTAGATKPTYTVDQAAYQLTHGYWNSKGYSDRHFNVETGGTITVNLSALNSTAKATALQALEAWEQVTGLTFVQASSAKITFATNQSGAFATSSTMGNEIISSKVNVNNTWQSYGDYYLQTYIHEIGHALGLGHAGNYNGSADFNTQAVFANDSWSMSVMSYFSQTQNPNINFSYSFTATPQLADIVAIQNLYGRPTTINTGDTTYGDGTNVNQTGMNLSGGWAVCLLDNGGTDTIDLASRGASQRLNLNAETYSDIDNKIGVLSIARGTVIENARTGSGNDTITGNEADNVLSGGAGNDVIQGGAGNDTLIGGGGADTLYGGAGADLFTYSSLADAGDAVADFSAGEGDRIDLGGILSGLGYTGDTAVADAVAAGVVYLTAASGGANLMVDADGNGAGAAVRLAFLGGVSASADVAGLLVGTGAGGGGGTGDTGGTGDGDTGGGDTGGGDTGDGDTGGGDTDSHYALTETFILSVGRYGWVLSDTDGGVDTLDLSAITSNMYIELTDGKYSRVAGKKLYIAQGTVIENAVAGASNDRVTGNGANNLLEGNDGNDKLSGLEGDDVLIGGAGNDTGYCGDGDDRFGGGVGNDRAYGGEGNDTMLGGVGNDRLYGEMGDDTLEGGEGRNTMYGGAGNDILLAGDEGDRMGGDGGNDILTGGAGNDRMGGGEGDDTLTGGLGDDRLYGDGGDDSLTGDDGKDTLYGRDGIDTLSGGSGDDRLYGDAGNDEMSGDDGNDRMYGGNGDDDMNGGAGLDQLRGGRDDDTLDGRADDDKLYGEAGDDVILGGQGNDVIDGGTGNDVIVGGLGLDRVKGGTGADTFVFTSVDDQGDIIYDFSQRSGDRFDISDLLAGNGLTLGQALGNGVLDFSRASSSASYLDFDLDGDGGADAVHLAVLRNVRDTAVLDDGWFA